MKFLQPGTISDRIFMGASTLIMWICGFTILYIGIVEVSRWFDFVALSIIGIGSLYVAYVITFPLGILPYVLKNRPL